MSYVVSWSGGKDSCSALYEAMSNGYQISHLVNFISNGLHRVSFHGTKADIIHLQSQALGIPLLQKETTWEGYEQEFKATVQSLIPSGVEGMIFGDIYLQEHKDWVERVCGDLGIKAIEPLWRKNTEEIVSDFIDNGFKATIICAKSELIDKHWIGQQIDRAFIDYLKGKNLDPCGENGEYHTLVTDGPIFNKQIQLIKNRTISRDGFWLLNTIKYKLGH